jgi:prophage regulatory protein
MRLIRIKEVMHRTGLARSTIYKFMKLDKFPKQVPIGGLAAWNEIEIDGWICEKIEIRNKAINEEKMKHILQA